MMNYKEACSLAKLVAAAAPWAEGIYALPVRPAEQQFPEGLSMVSLSSAFLRAVFYSPSDWLEVAQQLRPAPGLAGLSHIEQRLFDAWVRDQLARTDLEEREQRCSTKDLSLFAHHPYLNMLSLEVPFTVMVAPVVDGSEVAQNIHTPMLPETMLTVRWTCPVCGSTPVLSRRLPARVEDRISVPAPLHPGSGSQESCSADVWVNIEGDEPEGQEGEEPFSIRVWQVVHPQKAIGEPKAGQA